MKNSKLKYLWVFCMVFNLWIGQAKSQPGGPPSPERKEEIAAMKIGFLTKKLSLTTEEAKVFWPVYEKYQDELDKLRDGRRKERKAAKDEMDTMTDKELEKLVDGEITFRQAELDLMKNYNSQFKAVLPMKKVALLYRAEDDFKRELLQKIQERDRDGKSGPPPHRDDRK